MQREGGVPGPAPTPPAPPLIALEARSRLTLAWLDEITARPELLRAYGEETGDDDESLAVLVPRGADLQGLIELVESDELSSGEECDIIALPEPTTTRRARFWPVALVPDLASVRSRPPTRSCRSTRLSSEPCTT